MRVIAGVFAAALLLGACGDDAETVGAGRAARESASATCRGDLLAFFDPGTELSLLEELADRLAGRDDVEAVAVWDQEETYEEFIVLFASTPHIVDVVKAEILPPSVRVRAVSPEAKTDVAAAIEPSGSILEIVVDSFDPERVAQADGTGFDATVLCNPDFPSGPRLVEPRHSIFDDVVVSNSAAEGGTEVDAPLSPR